MEPVKYHVAETEIIADGPPVAERVCSDPDGEAGEHHDGIKLRGIVAGEDAELHERHADEHHHQDVEIFVERVGFEVMRLAIAEGDELEVAAEVRVNIFLEIVG